MRDKTFITAVLRSDYVERMIETLYKYTENFNLIVVDQTKDGLKHIDGVHLVLRPLRNLGFAKAMNEGILHGLHWKSEYIININDDVELISPRWWQGILDTFNNHDGNEILVVNPESIKIPLWGYGKPPNEYIEVIDYKNEFTDADYDFLLKGDFSHLKEKYPELPESFPLQYEGVCDAFAAFCPVFKRKFFDLIGMWEERCYPGGLDDYDAMCRTYRKKYRAVSTRKSWLYHAWGKSKDEQVKAQEMGMPIEDERRWADVTYLYPPEWNEGNPMDVWGFYTSKSGDKKPFKRREKIGIVEI
jgi:GT2 family glycosyltransferase